MVRSGTVLSPLTHTLSQTDSTRVGVRTSDREETKKTKEGQSPRRTRKDGGPGPSDGLTRGVGDAAN